MEEPYTITLDDGHVLEDVSFSLPLILASAKLRFLSVVETSRIPLHLILGTSCQVFTTQAHTSSWFSAILSRSAADEADAHKWWQQARSDSPLGVLVAVDHGTTQSTSIPRVTELLFYASTDKTSVPGTLTPPLSSLTDEYDPRQPYSTVRAIALSSDLSIQNSVPSPPQSPCDTAHYDGVFLSAAPREFDEIVHEPPTKKRRSAHDAFDEATERRKQAKRKGGQRVSSAAPSAPDTRIGPLKHQRSASANSSTVLLQTRPRCRAGSVVSVDSHSGIAKGGSLPAEKRSKLSTSTTNDVALDESTVEQKNKDAISRVVMAGMRLYGLVQSKSQKTGDGCSANGPVNGTDRRVEVEGLNDYKLVYHQVYKGACFAFRKHIATLPLSQHTAAVRNIVDELLALYCNDPLVADAFAQADITPSGRAAFGSARSLGETAFSTNAVPTEYGTPSVRRAAPALI